MLCEEIKRRLDHKSFFLRYCPEAQITAFRLKSRCPIPAHQHSGSGKESLSVDLNRGLYHCFSRAEGGDAIRFFEQMHGVSFARAVSMMAADVGLKRTRTSSLSQKAAPDSDHREQIETKKDATGAPRLSSICAKFLEVCRTEDQTEGENYLVRRGISVAVAGRLNVAYFPRFQLQACDEKDA
ncbi:MAG: CHC2 zinc finger domain-containing protein [Pyrinomonadaceae bacterium]